MLKRGNSNINANGPPSHNIEQNPDHLAFLKRSLARNDVDLSALIELNSSLILVKEKIVSCCGENENTLLHLGSGNIILDPSNHESLLHRSQLYKTYETFSAGATEQGLCVDFLLRMKLRRKLLNRLARRLNRVAHSMDGQDINPPGPPRYGDERLVINPSEMNQFESLMIRQDSVMRAMNELRESRQLQGNDDETAHREPSQFVINETSDLSEVPKSTTAISPEIDYNVIQSFDNAYEKLIDPNSSKSKYKILDQNTEEDSANFKYGNGIGATQRNMSVNEKETEFRRWQSSLWSRIRDQPTFADVGQERRVFLLEERYERALKLNNNEGLREDSSISISDAGEEVEDKIGKDVSKSNMEIDRDDKGESDKSKLASSGFYDGIELSDSISKAKGSTDDETVDSNKDINEQKTEMKSDQSNKQIKKIPISLSAVPSFYEQDLKRIRLIHHDIVGTSLRESARNRLDELTAIYNNALRRSTELNTRREHFEASLRSTTYQAQALAQQGGIHAMEQWVRAKQQFENEELNKILPSRWGRVPIGTNLTKQFERQQNCAAQQISQCVADLVDAVELISTNQVRPVQKYPIPCPASNAASNLVEQLKINETQLRNDIATLNVHLLQSEEERSRAWRRMIKTKGEFDQPHHMHMPLSNQVLGFQARDRLTVTNYHQIPLPRLPIPDRVPHVPHAVTAPLYVPPYMPQPQEAPVRNQAASTPFVSPRMNTSESRYSMARVKERIGNDGSVAPVSEPKLSKDGLYLRPAGRTRKGMEWDAVRGIWVPSSSGS